VGAAAAGADHLDLGGAQRLVLGRAPRQVAVEAAKSPRSAAMTPRIWSSPPSHCAPGCAFVKHS
jgi:hypothetical protein